MYSYAILFKKFLFLFIFHTYAKYISHYGMHAKVPLVVKPNKKWLFFLKDTIAAPTHRADSMWCCVWVEFIHQCHR